MTVEEFAKKQRLESHIEALHDMRQTMLADENWESMGRLIEACTSGAMAIKRIIKEDFGGKDERNT